MRMLLKATIPTELGNRAIKDGSFAKVMEATVAKLKPEAAYFVAERGRRCALFFFDMRDASDIPSTCNGSCSRRQAKRIADSYHG